MFLLDGGILLGTYFGVRLIEKYRKSGKNSKNKVSSKKSSQPMISDKQNLPGPTEKQFNHYLKLSTVSVGVAATRQFFLPSLGLFNAVLFTYIAFPMLRESEKSLLQNRKINGYVLETLLTVLALSQGQYFAAAMVLWSYYLGHKILAKTEDHSKKTLTAVFAQQPNFVWVLKDGVEIEVPLSKLKINDIVVVNTGEVVPIDGTIIKGIALIDQRALTGESQPADKGMGDTIFASTLLISGRIFVKVEKTGQDTTVAKIGQFLAQSAYFKTNLQSKGEELADKTVNPILGLGLLTLPWVGPYGMAAVLYCSFGNVIRVLSSLGTLNFLTVAARQGILVKDGRAIEYLNEVDTVLFDKTGTLTKEEPEIGQVIVCDNQYQADEVLQYAAAAERKLAHPIARAILKKASRSNLILPDIGDAQYQMGYGITVILKNQVIRVGSLRFMTMENIVIPQSLDALLTKTHDEGHSLVMVAIDDRLIGAIELQASVRPEIKSIVAGLRRRGIKHLAIVSGDHQQPTQKLAETLGMDDYFYEILPEQKAEIIEKLQQQGRKVCFVGDGINDAIALKKANVSVSLNGATTIATDMAQVVLMNGTLSHLCDLFDISRDLNKNLHYSLLTTVMSSVVNLSGIFLFHFGLLSVVLVANTATAIGVSNAMSPLLKLEKPNKKR